MILADLPDPAEDRAFYEGVPARRALAWVIDGLLILLASGLVTLVVGLLTLGLGFAFFPAIVFLLSFGYRWVTISAASATYGMALLGIEFRTRAGRRLTPLQAAVHTGVFLFLMASVIGWVATVISVLVTRYNQSLPDLLLGSTAIRLGRR